MVTAIASQKGGTGKSTTTISLSAGLARQGKKVLLIDLDPQANSSKVLVDDFINLSKEQTLHSTIIEREGLKIIPSKVENLDIVPSNILLTDTDMLLAAAVDNRALRLKLALEAVKGNYDYVFMDNPPALSWLTINAFAAAENILVTISPGYFELDSTVQIMKSIQNIKDNYNPTLNFLGFLFTMKTPNLESSHSYKMLRETYGDMVLGVQIPRNNDVAKSFMMKTDIFDFAPYSEAARAYNKLINDVFVRSDNNEK